MKTALDWVYRVFSSKAALPEISIIGLIGVVITYYGDRSKRLEVRNAHLLEIRKTSYDSTLTRIKTEVEEVNLRIDSYIETMARVRNGGERVMSAQVDVEAREFLRRGLPSSASSPFANLLGTTSAMIATIHTVLNILVVPYDPLESIEDPKDLVIAQNIPEKWDTEWGGLARRFQKVLNTSAKLIERQYRTEVSRLMPKDTFLHRLQDRRQGKKNQAMISKIFKEKKTAFPLKDTKEQSESKKIQINSLTLDRSRPHREIGDL